MAHFFRIYEKKRGERRTGSRAFGNFGEALFFGIFFVLGCVAFVYMWVALVWPEWRANRQFAPTKCVVVARQLGVKPATASEPARYRPEFRIRYQAEGQDYIADDVYDVTTLYSPDEEAMKAIVESFEVNQEYPCWYDPIDPRRVVLVRGYSGWLYLTLLIPLSFVIIGGGRLLYTLLGWSASAERRAVMTQRATKLDLFEAGAQDGSFPSVPTDDNLTNSPGTTLRYRLPIATTTGWTLLSAATACLLWNAIVVMFLVMAINSFANGTPDWMLTALVIVFAAAGIALVVYLVRQVLVTTGVGPTRIEISEHPLAPGNPYDIFLSQAGRLAMNSLEVWLACDEKATYRQGTDTRTETRRVFEQRCFVREDFSIHQGLPFESRCQISVPAGAMHSFHANHNEVIWKLIVKGKVTGWRDFERVFQIVVKPTLNGQHTDERSRTNHSG